MDEKQCKNCGTPRQAPCGNCGLEIAGTVKECPHCRYNKSEKVIQKSNGRKKKALGLSGVGVLLYLVASAATPGPGILGALVGLILGVPFIIWGGLIAFYYNTKETGAEDLTATDLSKGREQHKTKEWREMKMDERKEMLNAASKGLSTVASAANAYSERKRKQQKEQQLDEKLESADQMIADVQQEKELAQQEHEKALQKQQHAEQKQKQIDESIPDVPRGCPRCHTKWRGSGGLLSGAAFEELAPGKFQCLECGETVNLG
ncbi:hypothetical protein [Halomontanus rarus]|uniref:hypothetical protein n=1 Tax=Halomontanus rarus TaxID=3034020 RepID=UPI001A99ED89